MPELLTPDEIAALTAAFADAPPTERPPMGAVRTIDLANQERSLEGRLPGLDLVLERFARGVRGVLATCFGDVPSVRTASVGLVRFSRLGPRFAEPAGLVRFRLAPLRGQGIITIPAPLVAMMLQISCGGAAGQAATLPTREFTPVELRLIERLAVRVLAALRAAWEPITPLDGSLVQVETMPLFAAVAAPDELVVHTEITVVVSGLSPITLVLVLPNAALDPIRGRLQTARTIDDGRNPSSDAAWTTALEARLAEVPAEVTVELGAARIPVSRLLELAVGDLLTLDAGREGPVIVRVAGKPRFYGAPGIRNGNNAVRVDDRL